MGGKIAPFPEVICMLWNAFRELSCKLICSDIQVRPHTDDKKQKISSPANFKVQSHAAQRMLDAGLTPRKGSH